MRRSWFSGLLLLGLLLGSCRAPVEDQAIRLSPDSPPRIRDLPGGEQDTYRVQVKAGQSVHLEVDQRGIDVRCELSSSSEESLLVVDGLSSSWGPEEIFWLAKEDDDLWLRIQASRKGGRYEIKVRYLGPARQEDDLRAEAAWYFHTGRRFRNSGDRLQSIENYQNAADIWRKIDDRPRLAEALYGIGVVQSGAKKKEGAIRFFEEAAALFRAAGMVRMYASSLHLAGKVHHDLGDMEVARERFEEALQIREELDDPRGQAYTLNFLGMVNVILGEYELALTFYEEALERWHATGDRANEGMTLHNRGRCYLYLGQFQQALDVLNQALRIRQELGDLKGQARTLNALGLVYESLGVYPREGSIEPAAIVDRDLLRKAVHSLKNALKIGIDTQDRLGQAVTLSIMGRVYGKLGENIEALSTLNEARQTLHHFGYRHYEALVLCDMGTLRIRMGETEQALEHLYEALPFIEAMGRQHEIDALAHIALGEHQRGNLEQAREYIEKAIEKNDSLRIKPASHALRASLSALRHDFYGLYIYFLMESHRRNTALGYDAQALEVSERARARSQLEALIESGADLRQGADPELLERERNLEEQINAKELQRLHLLSGGMNVESSDRIASIERDVRGLLRDYEQTQAQARLSNSAYKTLTSPKPLSVLEIQQTLEPETLLLHYKLGKERCYLWAVTRDSISSFELPSRQLVEPLVRRTYELLGISNRRESRLPLRSALDSLSEILLGPIAALLKGQRLLIVSEGALQYIPFGALPIPTSKESLLVDFHEMTYMPSVSTLVEVRRQQAARTTAPGWLAVVADPVFQRHDPRFSARESSVVSTLREGSLDLRRFERLVFSEHEATAILDLVPAAKRFQALGFDANRDTVMSGGLSHYRIVHFATHAYVDAEQPELSRLVLSLLDEQSQNRDGFLFAHEIYGLELPTELVVLSACRTALGKEIRGEGLIGLTQAFMHAGAAKVLVSLWPVNDQATAELMARFYRYLLVDKIHPAASLRQAQLDIAQMTKWQAPYFWAGFVLQGGK